MLQRMFRSRKLRLNVFWQFFASFFVLVLVPSTVACSFTYVYVVKLIEEEVEKSSEILIGQFAEQTDELVGALQDEMIKQLGYLNLYKFLRYEDGPANHPARIDMLGALTTQITAVTQNYPLVHSAYLYHIGQQSIIASQIGYVEKDVYFAYWSHYASLGDRDIEAMFTGRRMMDFYGPTLIETKSLYTDQTLTAGTYLTAVMSYPFNSDKPEVYLVVNIDAERLKESIAIRRSDSIETAILDRTGRVLAHDGAGGIDGGTLLASYRPETEGHTNIDADGGKLQVSYHPSDRYDWIYVGMADLEELRRPAALIQKASALLLAFLLAAGGAIAYALSKRMYTPIRDIRQGLETSRRGAGAAEADRRQGNDFELIKAWSESLITEHKDMANRISGMSPVMHEYFLSKLLLGEFRDQLSVVYYAKEIGFDANPDGHLAVLCIEIEFYDRGAKALTETDKSFFITDLKHTIEKSIGGTVWLCQTRGDLLAAVVHLASESPAEPMRLAKTIRDALSEQKEYFHSAIGVGKVVHAVWELHDSYRHAALLLKRKRLLAEVEICSDQEKGEEPLPFDSFLSADKVEQMLTLSRAGRREELLEIVRRQLDDSLRSHASAEAVKQLCVDMLNTWLRAVAADGRQDFSIESYASLYQRLHRCVTGDDIRRFFEETASELFRDAGAEATLDQFGQIAAYIKENYGGELGIETFARQLHMSLGHFSRSFKEAVGENFIEFVTRCRMDAARRLLVDTDRKIDEIALEVGYLGRHSFIKTFRKYEGVTPGKYRELRKGQEPNRIAREERST